MSSSPKLIVKRTEPSKLVEEFSEFYCDLIPNLYNVKCPKFLEDVKCALKDIRRLKFDINVRHDNEFYVDIKYEEPSVRCAYMYAYNILNTAMVYHEFLKYLNNEEQAITNKLLGRKNLKICCLAGGPATEAIAVSKAIIDFCSKSVQKFDLFTDVEVTVVDIASEWETEGKALINALNKSSKLLNSKRVQFHYNFLKADIISGFSEILKEKIAEANVVTLVKFASSIEEKSASVCVSYLGNMINNVTDCMSGNSCLFMLDVAGGKLFKETMDVVSGQPYCLMKTSLHKKYKLLPKTLQKMEACINFRNVAGTTTLFPTVLTTISSCFWIKKLQKTVNKDTKILKCENAETGQSGRGHMKKKDNINCNDKNQKKSCKKK